MIYFYIREVLKTTTRWTNITPVFGMLKTFTVHLRRFWKAVDPRVQVYTIGFAKIMSVS